MDQLVTGSQPEPQSQSQADFKKIRSLIRNLKFGVEIETVVTGVQATEPVEELDFYNEFKEEMFWENAAQNVADTLVEAGVDCHVSFAEDKLKEDYTEWCIMADGSIAGDTDNNRYGIELVSPVLTYVDRDRWAGELAKIFTQLRSHDADATHVSCSTHVHVSKSPAWTLGDLKNLAGAIICFHPHLWCLAGKVGRDGITWAGQNRTNGVLRSRSAAEVLRMIDEAPAAFDVLRLLAPVAVGCREYQWGVWHVTGLSEYGVPPDDIDDAMRRRIAQKMLWAVCDEVKKTGTVECRLPPGSSSAEEAAMWADFAVLFVVAAVSRSAP